MMDRTGRDFLEALGCVALEVDPQTLHVTWIGAGVERLLGYRPEHCYLPDFIVAELIHPDDVEFVMAKLAHLYEDAPIELQFRAIRADRQIVRLRGRFVLGDVVLEGPWSIHGILCEFRDVSESQSVTEDRLQLALDAANMGIWDWNLAESTIFWSEQVYRLHDCTREELGSLFENYLTLIERIHPDDSEWVQTNVRDALRSGADYDLEYRFQLLDGSYRWLQVKGRIYKDDAGNPIRIAGTAQDVTARKTAERAAQAELKERKRAEAELTKLTETLEHRVRERTSELQKTNVRLQDEITERTRAERDLAGANRKLVQSNRELQDFAYVASHDLKEPLRKIMTFADLLQSECKEDLNVDGVFYVERMQESAARMMDLINDLLQFSRIKSKGQAFTVIDLNDVVAQVMSDIDVQVQEANGQVRIDPLPSIEADPTQMRQLFQNLISNAVKFRRRDAAPDIHVYAETCTADGSGEVGTHHLIVEDNGIGFDEHYASRIFTPFQRLHKEYEGTGMGLAICRRIAERHQGTINVSSKPGQGSRFVVKLPIPENAPGEKA